MVCADTPRGSDVGDGITIKRFLLAGLIQHFTITRGFRRSSGIPQALPSLVADRWRPRVSITNRRLRVGPSRTDCRQDHMAQRARALGGLADPISGIIWIIGRTTGPNVLQA